MMLVPNGVQGRLWAAVLITLVALETIAALVPPGGSTGAVPPRAAGETGWAPAAPPPKRTTTTTVTCTPGTIPVDSSTSCTATVRDTDNGKKTAPDGTVTWTTDGGGIPGGGTFSSPTCILIEDTDRSSCSVTYTPTAVGSGSHLITASYGGGGKHLPSSGTTTVAVTKRTAATTVGCGGLVIGGPAICTATVQDTDVGTRSPPSGTVTFTSSDPSGVFVLATCMLAATGTDAAACSATYVPGTAGSATITATYSGDAKHKVSSGSTTVSAAKRSTATSVACTQGSVVVDQTTTCTATVSDTGPGTKKTPTGTVTWMSSGVGTFSSATCTLDGTGKCSVMYTPTLVGSGTHTITASYPGDASHMGSSGSFPLGVGKRQTTTGVVCTPSQVPVESPTTCTATVFDASAGTKSPPSGTVSWASSGSGTFSSSSCLLIPDLVNGDRSSCSVTYTPHEVGTHTITGTYSGSEKHGASSGTADVLATTRQTDTKVSCSPSTVPVDSSTTCTATVTDTDSGISSTPTGTVSWSSSGSGTFSSTTCTLTAGQCSVSYTPTAIGSGIHTITADYGGDSTHAPSSGTTTVTVRARTTNTMVSCSPPSVPVDDSTTCTATVSDTDTGTASTPSGTVSFTTGASGTFTGNPCTLSSGSCSVTYKPTAVGTGIHPITATYNGDAKHASSSGMTGVAGTKRHTKTVVTCSPDNLPVDSTTTCTATVSDTDSGTKTTPTGTVTWTSGGGVGTFSSV